MKLEEPIQLTVYACDTYTIEVLPSDTIQTALNKAYLQTGILGRGFVYRGEVIRDPCKTIQDYDLQNGTLLLLLFDYRGG